MPGQLLDAHEVHVHVFPVGGVGVVVQLLADGGQQLGQALQVLWAGLSHLQREPLSTGVEKADLLSHLQGEAWYVQVLKG